MSKKPGATTLPLQVDHLRARERSGSCPILSIRPSTIMDVNGLVPPVTGIDESAVFQEDLHDVSEFLEFSFWCRADRGPPSGSATPFSTCCRITECSPSATSAEISTSRLIGPGCRIVMARPAFVEPSDG